MFARVLPLTLLVPPVGERRVPVSIRLVAALALAMPFCCNADVGKVDAVDVPTYLLWISRNLTVGLVIGGAVAIVLWAAQMAGTYLQATAGWQSPVAHPGLASNVMYLLMAALFVLIDGHHGVLIALSDSLALIPLGPEPVGAVAHAALVALPTRMLLASLMIAGPALLAALLALTMLAVAERVSVELSLAGLSSKLAPLAVLAALIVSLPVIASVLIWQVQATITYSIALMK